MFLCDMNEECNLAQTHGTVNEEGEESQPCSFTRPSSQWNTAQIFSNILAVLNTFPNDKFINWSKFKAVVDNKINVT